MPDINIPILKVEVTNDPLARGYSGMTNQQIADSLNTVNRALDRDRINTWEVLEATVQSEWTALSAAEKQRYQTYVSAGTLNPKGANVRAAFQAMFGAGTTTRTNLTALLTAPPVSRATELGLPFIGAHHVAEAKAS